MLYGSIFSLHNIFAILERISQIASVNASQLPFVNHASHDIFAVLSIIFGSVLGVEFPATLVVGVTREKILAARTVLLVVAQRPPSFFL